MVLESNEAWKPNYAIIPRRIVCAAMKKKTESLQGLGIMTK